ncbi:hypothetical protein [Chthonobacter albigriseus]|uniref:hypothetical protein n=1 Tax=Chthonobacter albigriseus TaxID=1683161 RepID=UPI0015EEB5D2|nr:hypothetical protein [Chthonobacter albigriseus]
MLKSFTSQAAIAAVIVSLGAIAAGMAPVAAEQTGTFDPADAAAAHLLAESRGDAVIDVPACELATWPYLPTECLRTENGRPVEEARWITVEARVGENVSALVRKPKSN